MTTTPHTIGKYQVLGELGRGGFATVYRARDATLEREVALKVLDPRRSFEPGFAARFMQEARVAARLKHPNIVTIHDVGDSDGQLYLAMELIEGRSLRERMQRDGALSLDETADLLAQVAAALDFAHAQGLVHRDVKPSNILLETLNDGRVRALLSDFGLVKPLSANTALTTTGETLGTVEYMAPEQADPDLAADLGAATDIYALGVVAYHMLIGQVPFTGTSASVLYAHVHKPPVLPPELSAHLPAHAMQAVLQALAKRPQERFGSASAFVTALRGATPASSPRSELRPEPRTEPARPRPAAPAQAQQPLIVPLNERIRFLAMFSPITGLALLLGIIIGDGNQLLTGVAMGALAGAAQWFLLRRYVRDEGGWIVATTLGYALSWPLADLFDGGMSESWVFLVIGLVVGLAQAQALRRHTDDYQWWIPASVAAYAIAAILASTVTEAITSGLGVWDLGNFIFAFVVGAAASLSQAVSLVTMRHRA